MNMSIHPATMNINEEKSILTQSKRNVISEQELPSARKMNNDNKVLNTL